MKTRRPWFFSASRTEVHLLRPPQAERVPETDTEPRSFEGVGAGIALGMGTAGRSGGRPFATRLVSSALAPLPALQQAPTPSCAHCKGAGYLRLDVPYGHPRFGKAVECSCQRSKKQERRIQELRTLSHLDSLPGLKEATFEHFDLCFPGVQEAYEAALAFAETPAGWLLLLGPRGCGKTHLATAIAWRCLEAGKTTLFAPVPDVLDYLRAAFAPSAPLSYDKAFGRLRQAEILILDDLGTQQSTAWANEKLFQLMNWRYMAQLPTVFTTNLDIAALEPRLGSRLSDRSLVQRVEMKEGEDMRPHKPLLPEKER